jgi:hypothetical protein
MTINKLSFNNNLSNDAISPLQKDVSEEEIYKRTVQAVVAKAEILAGKLGVSVPEGDPWSALNELTREAEMRSLRDKKAADINSGDLRGPGGTALLVIAGATNNRSLMSQIIGEEIAQDGKNDEALQKLDKANTKGIVVQEYLIVDGNSLELNNIDHKINTIDNLEEKGIYVDSNSAEDSQNLSGNKGKEFGLSDSFNNDSSPSSYKTTNSLSKI